MAVQVGPHPFRGTIGNLTGYIRRGKYHLRRKSSITKEKMLNNPRSRNTFLNAIEMKTAISGGQLIRQDLRQFLMKGKDCQHHNRLSGLLRLALNSDSINVKGSRSLQHVSLAHLKGYNFNLTGLLGSCFNATYKTLIDRSKGVAKLSVASFVPGRHLNFAEGATHFEIISVASEIVFEASINNTSIKRSKILAINSEATEEMVFEHDIKPKSSNPILMMMGVRYYKEMNGRLEQVTDRRFCPLSVVDVSSGKGFHLLHPTTGILQINEEQISRTQKKLLDKVMNKVMERIIENGG